MKTPGAKQQTKTVKLVGGPLTGQTVTVPRSADSFRVSKIARFWTYSYAGKDGRQEFFAIHPKSRIEKKALLWFIRKYGKDPRREHEAQRREPIAGTKVVKRGRGAAKRRAKANA